jgi:hypothetical protein
MGWTVSVKAKKQSRLLNCNFWRQSKNITISALREEISGAGPENAAPQIGCSTKEEKNFTSKKI